MKKKLIFAAAAFCLILGISPFAQEKEESPSEPGKETVDIDVNATATVLSRPDTAEVTFEINEESDNAEEAMKNCSARAEKVLAALLENGTEESDVSTESTTVSPRYNYSDSDSPRITGYLANISIRVKGQKADEIGSVISAAMTGGADSVYGPSFYCSDYDQKYEEALAQAVSAARAKAEVIARAAGKEKVIFKSISEGYQNTVYKSANAITESMAMEDTAAAWSVPVEVQTAEITASITAYFEAE